MTNPALFLKDGTEIPEGIWMHLWLRYVLFMILKIKITQGLDQFIS